MQRRKFLKYGVGSILTAPLILGRYSHLYAYRYASPVACVVDDRATSIQYQPGKTVNSDGVIVDKILSSDIDNLRVARMVDTAIMKLTGKDSLGKAWESLFPAGHPNMNTKIGIKLNFSYGDWRDDLENDWSKLYCPFGPKAAVTNAILSGLTQMMDGTFPIENITLFERMYLAGTRRFYPVIQGYRPVSENEDGLFKSSIPGTYAAHWIFSTNPLELPDGAPEFIAAPEYSGEYKAPQKIYSAVYNNDFLINYAIAKDHRAAGITGSMKNNYGCTNNPFGTHGNEWKNDDSPYAGTGLCIPMFHKYIDQSAPYILHIMDALTGIYHGGPLSGNVFQGNAIAVSKDAVAIDAYLLDIINKARRDKGLSLIDITDGRTPDRHPHASFLRIAAENLELGSLSMDNLKTYDLSSSSEEYMVPTVQNPKSLVSGVRMDNGISRLQVILDKSGRSRSVESRIEDIGGKVIRSFRSTSTQSSRLVLEWDQKNDNQTTVRPGVYIWYVWVDGAMHTSTINNMMS